MAEYSSTKLRTGRSNIFNLVDLFHRFYRYYKYTNFSANESIWNRESTELKRWVQSTRCYPKTPDVARFYLKLPVVTDVSQLLPGGMCKKKRCESTMVQVINKDLNNTGATLPRLLYVPPITHPADREKDSHSERHPDTHIKTNRYLLLPLFNWRNCLCLADPVWVYVCVSRYVCMSECLGVYVCLCVWGMSSEKLGSFKHLFTRGAS